MRTYAQVKAEYPGIGIRDAGNNEEAPDDLMVPDWVIAKTRANRVTVVDRSKFHEDRAEESNSVI